MSLTHFIIVVVRLFIGIVACDIAFGLVSNVGTSSTTIPLTGGLAPRWTLARTRMGRLLGPNSFPSAHHSPLGLKAPARALAEVEVSGQVANRRGRT